MQRTFAHRMSASSNCLLAAISYRQGISRMAFGGRCLITPGMDRGREKIHGMAIGKRMEKWIFASNQHHCT